jgi:NAD-dependent deacetylase
VRKWVEDARAIVVLTGAGISTDSGIPDFRGPNGVWTKNPGAEKTATLSHYMSNPDVRKQAWRNRVESPMWDAQPNTGHLAIAELEKAGRVIAVITQNVDGLHLKAGSDPDRLIEVHGNTREVVCMQCGEMAPMERALDRVRKGEEDPPCRTCGGILKSATISFGQNLVEDDLIRADHAARSCDLLLAIGSTLGVYPAAGVVPIAKRHGARIVIINAEPTEMDDIADAVLRGPISELLPPLVGMSTP